MDDSFSKPTRAELLQPSLPKARNNLAGSALRPPSQSSQMYSAVIGNIRMAPSNQRLGFSKQLQPSEFRADEQPSQVTRPRERSSWAESKMVENSVPRQTDRLSTEEIIPSFRERYQIYELLQQISEHKRVVDMKNKEIFYLSNQIVSLKDEFTQKAIHMESIIAENKRELTELRYAGLKTKKQESEKGERLVEELKRGYELQLHNMRQAQEELIGKMQEQHRKEVQNMEEKYGSLLVLEKKERNSMEQIFQEKAANYEAIISQLEAQNDRIRKQKQQDHFQNNLQQQTVQKLKQQFNKFSEKASAQQRQQRIETEDLKSQIVSLKATNTNLARENSKISERATKQIEEHQQANQILTEELKKLKSLLLTKDREISKLLEEGNKDRLSRMRRGEEKQLDPLRACNHEGLIAQLERGLALKAKENEQLRQQLKEWGKFIGFEKSAYDRSLDLLNASSQALQTQQSFKNSLKARAKNLN